MTNSSPPKRPGVSPSRTASLQPLGRGDEQLVAGDVPEAVVHALEVVEIDEQHRDLAGAPARAGEREIEVIDEQIAQRKAGERCRASLRTRAAPRSCGAR